MPENNKNLSARELEVLNLIVEGASNKEISKRLFISANTVKVHLRKIFSKLDVNSRTEAAIYALNEGLVSGAPGNHEDVERGDSEGLQEEQFLAQLLTSYRIIIALVLFLILVFIGFSIFVYWQTSKSSRSIEISPQVASWQLLEPMPTARSGAAVGMFEDKIYVLAGETTLGATSAVEVLNLIDNQWTGLTPKPTPVYDVHAAIIGGKIYVPGGCLESGRATNVLEIYDPYLDEWTEGTSLPISICGYASATYEGQLFIFGGWDGSKYLQSVYRYDPKLELWVRLPDLPTERAYAGAAVAFGKIYVLGGLNDNGALSTNELLILQTEADQPYWEVGGDLPIQRYSMGVTSIGDMIYIIGGAGGKGMKMSLIYIPQQEIWQTLEGLILDDWSGLGMTNGGAFIYAVGGQTNDEFLSETLKYQAIYNAQLPIIDR